jgi:hypothetical protein
MSELVLFFFLILHTPNMSSRNPGDTLTPGGIPLTYIRIYCIQLGVKGAACQRIQRKCSLLLEVNNDT